MQIAVNPFKALRVFIFIFYRQQNAMGSASTVKFEFILVSDFYFPPE